MADDVTLTGGAVVAADQIGSVYFPRNKLIHGADGTNDGDVAKTNPLPVMQRHDSAVMIQLFATAAAAGANATETAITLSKSPSPGGTVTTGTSFVITSGKRFRITSITFGSRGHATATIHTTTFSLRVNTGGAVTTSSAVLLAARLSAPATANAYDRWSPNLGDMGIEILGDGTLTFGVTAQAAYTTNAPTWDVTITGFEY